MNNIVHMWFQDIGLLISAASIVEVYKKYREYVEGLK
jgi:hypothetical protein